jgi:hypothetical protein
MCLFPASAFGQSCAERTSLAAFGKLGTVRDAVTRGLVFHIVCVPQSTSLSEALSAADMHKSRSRLSPAVTGPTWQFKSMFSVWYRDLFFYAFFEKSVDIWTDRDSSGRKSWRARQPRFQAYHGNWGARSESCLPGFHDGV